MNETSQQQQYPRKEKREFTTAALKDELTKQLSSRLETVTDPETSDTDRRYKYHVYARKLLYRTNLAIPTPVFEISLSDLSQELKDELERLEDDESLNDIVVDAISRMYESVNSDYFHTSEIRGKIRWKFVE